MTLDEAVKNVELHLDGRGPGSTTMRKSFRTLLAAVRPEKKSPGRVFYDAAFQDGKWEAMREHQHCYEAGAAAVLRECAVDYVLTDDLLCAPEFKRLVADSDIYCEDIRAFVIRRIQERKGQ